MIRFLLGLTSPCLQSYMWEEKLATRSETGVREAEQVVLTATMQIRERFKI